MVGCLFKHKSLVVLYTNMVISTGVVFFDVNMRSEKLDTKRVVRAENLCLAFFDQDVQRLEEHVVVQAVQFCSHCPLPLTHFVHGQHTPPLRRVVDIFLNQSSPLLGLLPVHEDDILAGPGPGELCSSVLAHELEDLVDVGETQAAAEAGVVEEVRLGGGRDGELEEAVVAGVGEDQGGPLCELGVVRGQVGLGGEEGGEVVLAGEGEGRC